MLRPVLVGEAQAQAQSVPMPAWARVGLGAVLVVVLLAVRPKTVGVVVRVALPPTMAPPPPMGVAARVHQPVVAARAMGDHQFTALRGVAEQAALMWRARSSLVLRVAQCPVLPLVVAARPAL